MTTFLLGGIFVAGVICVAEGYLLIGRAHLLNQFGEQLLGAVRVLLADVPGKSAEHTVAALDLKPRTWWQREPAAPTADERWAEQPTWDEQKAADLARRMEEVAEEELLTTSSVSSGLAVDGEPDFTPDPDPATAPIPRQPGPDTQPAQAVIADDWQRTSDALYEQMMAEIRGRKS